MKLRALLPRLLGWTACVLLALPPRDFSRPTSGSIYERLSQPIASLVASFLWVRFDWHWRMGRPGEALRAAERALAVDPSSEEGWIALALHLAQDRASARLATTPEERAEWIAEGLLVLERGERVVSRPAELAFMRGILLAELWRSLLREASPPAWPGGSEAAFEAAAAAFRSAASAGHEGATERLAGLLHQSSEAGLGR